MSVIVKGMKMPKNCFYCAMSSFGVCNIAVRIWDISTRPDWCPLVELPEKHGRLIDADTAYDRIMEQEGGNLVDMDCVGMGLEECETIVEEEGEGEEAGSRE